MSPHKAASNRTLRISQKSDVFVTVRNRALRITLSPCPTIRTAATEFPQHGARSSAQMPEPHVHRLRLGGQHPMLWISHSKKAGVRATGLLLWLWLDMRTAPRRNQQRGDADGQRPGCVSWASCHQLRGTQPLRLGATTRVPPLPRQTLEVWSTSPRADRECKTSLCVISGSVPWEGRHTQ